MIGLLIAAFLMVAAVAYARRTVPSVDPGRVRLPVTSDRVLRIARAIAKAEGFYVEGSLPNRSNNPGALKLDGQSLSRFPDAESGWLALYQQVRIMLENQSSYYTPDMTLRQIAYIYTGNDRPDAWARIVADDLGVTPDTELRSV